MSKPASSIVRPRIVAASLENTIRPDTPGRLLVPSEIAPIEQIIGVWRFVRMPGEDTRIFTLAGHLIQLVVDGSYTLRTLGSEYSITKGSLIYYRDSQEVETLDVFRPVTFYSVGFIAPFLHLSLAQDRVMRSTKAIRQAFSALYNVTRTADPVCRKLCAFAALYRLLALISHVHSMSLGGTKEENTWWAIERDLRQKGIFRPTIKDLCRVFHRSRATINRLCRKATETSPIRRLQAVRMAEAMSLLKYCPMTVTQTAEYLGYTRMHEFSREFSAYFGMCPSAIRRPPE